NKNLLNYPEPRYGQPILNLAVINRDLISVQALLKLGANPNKQDYNGNSALMQSLSIGIERYVDENAQPDKKFLRLLLKYGGDPNSKQNPKKINHNAKFTALELACRWGEIDYVKMLVAAGAQINSTKYKDSDPLLTAVASGRPDIVMFLLENGADYKRVMLIDSDGENQYFSDIIVTMWNFSEDSWQYKEMIKVKHWLKMHATK
ncbi:MAG: ankyrin repeat domain-containing protein, partial [Pedobacter sp.]